MGSVRQMFVPTYQCLSQFLWSLRMKFMTAEFAHIRVYGMDRIEFLDQQRSRLSDAIECGDVSIYNTLHTGCTAELLKSARDGDIEAFFREESTNAFLQFIGGRLLFNQLELQEYHFYWCDDLKKTIETLFIAHCMHPYTDPFINNVAEIVQGSDPTKMPDIQEIIQKVIKTPNVCENIMSLSKDAATIDKLSEDMINMLEGMMISTPTPTCATTTESTVVETLVPQTTPGAYLKQQRQQREERQKELQSTSDPLRVLRDMLVNMRTATINADDGDGDDTQADAMIQALGAVMGPKGPELLSSMFKMTSK